MKKSKALFIALSMLLLAGLANSPTILAAEPYHLGVAMGLTGTGAPWSADTVNGVEMAVDEINSRGGLLKKHPIKLFIKDTQTRLDVAEQVVKDLIRKDKVQSIIGTYSSATALAIKPICRDNKVLHIAPISNSEDITKLDFSPYTYSVVPNTYMLSKAVVVGIAELAKKKGWSKYITIASDYAWGRSSQQIEVALLKQILPNIKLIGEYWPRLGQSRFNSFIVAIMGQKPDFVLGNIAGADNDLFMRDAREYRFFKEIEYPGGVISVTELITQAKSLRRGVYGRNRAPFWAHLDVPIMADFVKKYRAKYNQYPTDWAVIAYDAVNILKQGIEKAGSINTEMVKDAMKGMTVETTRGKLFFRKIDNQLSCSAYFGKVADDPNYPFPIFHDLLELKAPDNWRPESEIIEAREEEKKSY
jgi:branched-chain amino acid transport system substrate-binding protein